MNRKLLFCLGLVLCTTCRAQDTLDVFCLIIGNGHFAPGQPSPETPLLNVPAALESAKRFSALMQAGHVRESKVVLSDPKDLLSRQDLIAEVDSWIARAVASGSKHPLLLFYYAGHGLMDRNLGPYLPPGDLLGDFRAFNDSAWQQHTVPVSLFRDKLSAARIQHLLFFDFCYEVPQKTPAIHLTESGVDTAKTVIKIADMSKGVGGLFGKDIALSALKGTYVNHDPTFFPKLPTGSVAWALSYGFQDGNRKVGPLCARIHALINGRLSEQRSLSVADLCEPLSADEVIAGTGRPFMLWKRAPTENNIFFKR